MQHEQNIISYVDIILALTILALVMTIDKSQGQSFNKVGLYLSQPVSNHGQLYVVLSRTRNELNLKVQIDDCENKKYGTERSTAVKIFDALTLIVSYIFINKHFNIIWIYFI